MKKTGKKRKISGFAVHPMERLNHNEHMAIIEPVHRSLRAFESDSATPTDWYNLMFRTHTASLIAAQRHYTDETVSQIEEVKLTLFKIERRSFEAQRASWKALDDELDDLKAVVQAADTIQMECTRVQLYNATKETAKYMRQFL